MDTSPSDREEIARRVLQRTTGGRARPGIVRPSGDRVVGGIPEAAAAPEPTRLLLVHRESTPDLASRWRRAVAGRVDLGSLGVATEGRHTVVVARVRASQEREAREAALSLSAQCIVREDG